jgi:hypothetical protein
MNEIKLSLGTLLFAHDQSDSLVSVISKDKEYVDRVVNQPISADHFSFLKNHVRYVGVTSNFREIIDYFKTPAGFRIEYKLTESNVLRVDLGRDISFDRNGQKRPTKVLFSTDSANPYEVEPVKNVIASRTSVFGQIYDSSSGNILSMAVYECCQWTETVI